MTDKKKTISGAMYSAPNLEHNLRKHIPPNSVEERRERNYVYTQDGDITLEQVYEKLFTDSYKEWREKEIRKGRGKRFPETYYEKIAQDKQKKLIYEVIWQIGDMRDTGFEYNPVDACRAEGLLDNFAEYLMNLPEVCVITQKELDDPEWRPPFEAGLIVHKMVYHGDENSPHIHMTYIPYTTHSKTGATVQNAFAQTFQDIGYPTTMKQAVMETGELVWQTDEDGNRIPQMKRDKFGGADWVETQKAVLQEMMLKDYEWGRTYKGSNPRGNLTLSDYRREKAEEMAKEAEQKLDFVLEMVENGKEKVLAQTRQVEELEAGLKKGMEAEEKLSDKIADRYTELNRIERDLTDKKKKVEEEKTVLKALESDVDEKMRKSRLAEELLDYFGRLSSSEKEQEYFEKVLDLTYENQNLKAENVGLKRENGILRDKLERAYEFMKQFTIGGVNMLKCSPCQGHF